MNPYFILPLSSGLACLAFGAVIRARDPEATANRCVSALLIGASFWGVCEALWTLAPDAVTAERILRLSALGWVGVGALSMHLFVEQQPRESRRLRDLLPIAYGIAAGFLGLTWIEPFLDSRWMAIAMVPQPWGWSYRVGPLYPYWYAFTVLSSTAGVFAAYWAMHRSASPAEAVQKPILGTAVGAPLILGSTTDGLLPALGIDAPCLGVFSFAVFGAFIAWSQHRYGFSVLAPSSFAGPILESMPEGVALVTAEGRVRSANPALARLLDIPEADLRNAEVRSFFPSIDSLDVEIRERETELVAASGAIPVALSVTPLRDKRGASIGEVLVVRDLREVASLRARLLTTARLAAVGELAAGIAHEINNPLAYIGANLRALREHWSTVAEAWRADAVKEDVGELLGEGAEMLDDSLEGVERAAAIVRDVRAFSHGGSDRRERFDPNELIERALRVATPHLRGRVRVERALGEVGLVEGARREIEQVLLNLIVNAAQAIDGPGTLRLRSTSVDDAIAIAIADSGRGIAAEHAARIFDPFFTTKPVGEGTGLGLSISHEIVRRHGGRIEVASTPGRGTEFTVWLPTAEA